MKRLFLFLLLAFVIGGCLSLGAFAADSDGVEVEIPSSISDASLPYRWDYSGIGVLSDLSEGATSSPASGVSILSVAPIQPDGSGSLKDTLLSLIGDYDPVVLEYSYQSSQGYTSYLREVQLDYPWLASAVIFLVLVYCSFATLSRAIFGRR